MSQSPPTSNPPPILSTSKATHISHGKPVDLSQILATTWKTFEFGSDHFIFHIQSSSLMSIPKLVYDKIQNEGESAAEDVPELVKFIESLPPEKPEPAPKLQCNGIALNVAEVCNLRCKYCYAGDGNYGVDSLMSWETAEKILKFFLAQTDRLHIVFFGGEPMLNYELIKQVVAWCEKQSGKRFTYSMTTNATLLTSDALKWLKEKNFSLSISWDGHGVHAKQRLTKDKIANSETQVFRKLAQLQNQILELKGVQLRGTVMEQNIPLMEEAIVQTLSTMPHAYMSAVATQSSEYHIALPGMHETQSIVRRVVMRLLDEKDYDKLKRFRTIWQSVSKIHRRERRTMTCGAGVNYFSVSTSGKFYLCHRFTEDESERMGSVEEGFYEKRLESIRHHRLTKHAPCNACWMRETCAGGCFHENKIANNTEFFADPKFCLTQHMMLSLGIEVYVRLLKEAPQVLDNTKINWRTENV